MIPVAMPNMALLTVVVILAVCAWLAVVALGGWYLGLLLLPRRPAASG